jgi:hypothetical protein
MQSQNSSVKPSADISVDSAFFSLAYSARLEFQACLQLLAERASFLTAAKGVAIAVLDGEAFVYSATVGCSVPEPGGLLETSNDLVRNCIASGSAVHSDSVAGQGDSVLVVPVKISGRAVGFFELTSPYHFGEEDIEAITRLAGLLNVAIEHRDAAVEAEKYAIAPMPEADTPTVTKLWHAPEVVAEPAPEAELNRASSSVGSEIHSCTGCGFPVSAGRRLCVECEQKAGAPSPVAELFQAADQESWITAHGYTIATILVTAFALAIILWLR